MTEPMKPLSLAPFMIADIRPDDAACVFPTVSCRVYRFSSERVEIIAPLELPDLLCHIKVNINLGGMLALNVPGAITRRLRFDSYVLIEVSLAPNPNRVDQFALQRIAEAVTAKKAVYGEAEIRFGSIAETGFDIPYVDGFVFNHPAFQLSINGCTMQTTVFKALGLQDYEIYVLVNHLAGKRIRERFGFFDRVVNMGALADSLFGPLDVLLSYELYVWSVGGGMRHGSVRLSDEKFEHDPNILFDLFSGLLRTPGPCDKLWSFKAEGIIESAAVEPFAEDLRLSSM